MATPLCRRTDLCVDMDEQTSKPSSKTGSYYKLKNSVTAALQRRIQILPVNMTCDSEEQMEVGNEDIGGETTRVVIGAESFVTLSSDRPELFSPMPQIGHAFFYTLQTVSKMAALAPRRMVRTPYAQWVYHINVWVAFEAGGERRSRGQKRRPREDQSIQHVASQSRCHRGRIEKEAGIVILLHVTFYSRWLTMRHRRRKRTLKKSPTSLSSQTRTRRFR